MRNVCLILSLGLLLGPFATNVPAAERICARANVPFDFIVANAEFVAGNYDFSRIERSFGIAVSRRDGKGERGYFLTNPADDSLVKGKVRPFLIFHKVGERYHLSSIHVAGLGLNMTFPAPRDREERHLITSGAAERIVIAAYIPAR
jgi:hypothetical protein